MPRTLEELSDHLSRDIAWRKRELSSLKRNIALSKDDLAQRLLLRAGVAVLYAHWEGFVKEASGAYLDFVSRRRLTYDQLAINFVALDIKRQIDAAAQNDDQEARIEIVRFLTTSRSSKRSTLPREMDTRSNLNSKILKGIILMLGLDYSFFKDNEHLIDLKLLEMRNKIAHGNYLLVDTESFAELQVKTLAMMEDFRNQIDNAAVLEAYKAA